MGIFVTIIILALFFHWTCSSINMQWCTCMCRNSGVKAYAVHQLLFSLFLMLSLTF